MAPVASMALVTAEADLQGGTTLYDPTYSMEAMNLVAKHGLTRIRQHVATLEYEDTAMEVINLSMLGSARGLDIMGNPAHGLTYGKMIVELDSLDGMTNPGPQLKHPTSGERRSVQLRLRRAARLGANI